jgi:transcriptional regulator with XRE-family HTH domain
MPSLETHMSQRITAQRALLGVTVEALARRTGLPPMRLEAYEAGLRRVTASDLLRLCDALKVGPACLLGNLAGAGTEASEDADDPRDVRTPRHVV